MSTAGVVVSCKIPILATRVRFPGGALTPFFLTALFLVARSHERSDLFTHHYVHRFGCKERGTEEDHRK